jgi:hypothetical protein
MAISAALIGPISMLWSLRVLRQIITEILQSTMAHVQPPLRQRVASSAAHDSRCVQTFVPLG